MKQFFGMSQRGRIEEAVSGIKNPQFLMHSEETLDQSNKTQQNKKPLLQTTTLSVY